MVSLFSNPTYNTIGDPYNDAPSEGRYLTMKTREVGNRHFYTQPAKNGQLDRQFQPKAKDYIPGDEFQDKGYYDKLDEKSRRSKIRKPFIPTSQGELISNKTSLNTKSNEGCFSRYEWIPGDTLGSKCKVLPFSGSGTAVSGTNQPRNVVIGATTDAKQGINSQPLAGRRARHQAVDNESIERSNRRYKHGEHPGFRPNSDPCGPFHKGRTMPELFDKNIYHIEARERKGEHWPPNAPANGDDLGDGSNRPVHANAWKVVGDSKLGNTAEIGFGKYPRHMVDPYVDQPLKQVEKELQMSGCPPVGEGYWQPTNPTKTREVPSVVYGRRNYLAGIGTRV